MKPSLFLLTLICSTLFISCQKEAGIIHESPDPVSSNANNNSNNVPFIGEYTTTHQMLGGPAMQRITGVGSATHLGASTFVATVTVNITPPPPFAVQGTAVFTAANGDQFYTSIVGTTTPTGPTSATGSFVHTITGGTGRFADASGQLVATSSFNPQTLTGLVNFEGSINY